MDRPVFSETLIDALSAANAAGVLGPARLAKCRELTFLVKFGAGTTAGVVTIEAAANPDDADTWASLGTASWAAASRTHVVSVTGVHLAVRARISTAIVGGTVTVVAVGN